MALHALIRKISPYTGPDLFLGLFSDVAKAGAAREAYLMRVSTADPWSQQAYRKVDLGSDVRTVEISDFRGPADDSRVVFLVTAYLEDMGQISRWFLGVFSERLAAAEFAAREEARPIDVAPSRCEVDDVVLDVAR
ncbi:MAG: hypothetical protein JWL65_604 [Gammaproteobacteria bacterium]|nr:hypothetical protein [Gammaproteobacteria bacterium]